MHFSGTGNSKFSVVTNNNVLTYTGSEKATSNAQTSRIIIGFLRSVGTLWL